MAAKVLLVDDELAIRESLYEFLTDEGYDVIMAPNGRQVLGQVVKEKPRLILLDVNMPGISGAKVCKTLKMDERTRSIPIIIITGLPYTETEAFEVGADDLVKKPFELAELSVRVKSALGIES